MPLPHAQMCVEWSVCAAVEPADDAAAALHEQKIVAGREADAARRRRSREADATATFRCVLSGLCAVRCVMCVGQAAAHVLCLVAPEMSELQRCLGDAAFGVSMVAHYCAISPSQPLFIAYNTNIVQYIFPTTPFIYCNTQCQNSPIFRHPNFFFGRKESLVAP